ncbi:MAG: glycerol-3-phosphate dehydrogenase/oxidase [Acidimicrobiales bacterium]
MPAFDRAEALGRLATEPFDVVVVGGGITGAGVALDAASRGLRTALVERHDFASGTSSRSSKFVHGGLRYLHQRQFRLVAESLAEQRRLLRNAPHLVRPLPVLLPVPAGQPLRKLASAALLAAHDAIGGGGRSRMTAAGVIFHEAQVDDARLTLAVIRTAVLDHGAVAANYCPVVRVDHGVVHIEDGTRIRTRAVVNATGVWSDMVRPAKGVHVVVDRGRIPFATAVVLRLPGVNRWVFVAPWEGKVEIGTTDTDYDGPLDDPQATEDEVAGLLAAVNGFLPDPLRPEDVRSAWAGLRPLVQGDGRAATADLSRRHRVVSSPGGAVVTVVGGKLTTYRRMAADAVDAVLDVLGERHCPARTARLPLHDGGPLDKSAPSRLWHRYGADWTAVESLVSADPALAEPLVPGLTYTKAEAVYAVRHEMAVTVDDLLSRRTRASFLDRAAAEGAAPSVAALLARPATGRR